MILTAFKSNLCQIIQNLAKKMLNVKPTAAHHLIASQIQTIYQMIRKHPQNGNLKGISTLLLAVWPIGNTYDTVLAAVVLWRSSIYQLFKFLFLPVSTAWKIFSTLLQSPTGNC